MKKENELLKEDLAFINSIENWDYVSVWDKELDQFKSDWKQIAENTINKKTRKKPLNIRLIEEDIIKIKAIALRQWLPYQTYLASEIHKMVNK